MIDAPRLTAAEVERLCGGYVDSEWLAARSLAIFDSRGRRIDFVRACRAEPDGVRVRILGTVNGGELAVIGASRRAVEFSALVVGAQIKADTEEP